MVKYIGCELPSNKWSTQKNDKLSQQDKFKMKNNKDKLYTKNKLGLKAD